MNIRESGFFIKNVKRKSKNSKVVQSVLYPAAVSCSPVLYRLGAGGIWVWDDGQAGPCMGRCVGAYPCLVFMHILPLCVCGMR